MKFKLSINNFFLIMKKLKFLSPLAVDDGLWGFTRRGPLNLGITRSTPLLVERNLIYMDRQQKQKQAIKYSFNLSFLVLVFVIMVCS